LDFPAHFPVAHVQVSPQEPLQSVHLQSALLQDELPHLHLSLHVQLPLVSLHTHKLSQVHLPSAVAQLIVFASAFFKAQHLSPAEAEMAIIKKTKQKIEIVRII
jgi:hypothetical protein